MKSFKILQRRIKFVVRIVMDRLFSKNEASCPYCGCASSHVVGRKYLVLELRRCVDCALMYRFPTDSFEFANSFYQKQYDEGLVTAFPTGESLENLKANLFSGTVLDNAERIKIVKMVANSGAALLDYGCSWGYATWQLRQAGFTVTGFEISKPRGEFAIRNLDIPVVFNVKELDSCPRGSFDVIFTSHVLEHIPDLNEVFSRFQRLLSDSGRLIIFVPNCVGRSAKENGVYWGPMINEKHVLALTPNFLRNALKQHGFISNFFSSPYDIPGISHDYANGSDSASLDGDELLVIAHKIR